MKKIYHLASCTTCQKIIKDWQVPANIPLQDIKTEKISPEELDELKALAGNYEILFSRRALKYKEWGLNKMELSEDDYRRYILEEYTFLKRPILIWEKEVFIGNSPKIVEAAKNRLR